MATTDTSAPDVNAPSIGELVRDVSTNLSTLVRSELELAKLELAAEVKKAARGAIFFIAALAVLLLALPFIFVTIAEVLIAIGLWRWLGYLVVTMFFLVLSGLFGYLGYRKVRRIKAPQRTIDTVKGHKTLFQRPPEADEAPASPPPSTSPTPTS